MNTNKILGWVDVRNIEGIEPMRLFGSRSIARSKAIGKVTKVKFEKPDDKHLVAKAWGVFDRYDQVLVDIYPKRSEARSDYSGVKIYKIKSVYLDSSK